MINVPVDNNDKDSPTSTTTTTTNTLLIPTQLCTITENHVASSLTDKAG